MDEMISPQTFDQLRSLGHHALASGQVEEALRLLEQAIESARVSGDREQIDLALCNRSSVAIALGEEREVLAVLRPILLRSGRADVCFLAADGLSRAYELGKEFKKGLFYARASLSYAKRSGRPDWIASGHNQSGNCLTGTSHFETAYSAYEQARQTLEDGPQRPESAVVHTGVLVNLGYCKMMLGSMRRGMSLSFRALRTYRRLGTQAYDAWPHLDLSYGYLELGRFERARQHAKQALRLAEEQHIDVLQKNALFLLGETEKACGRYTESHAYFARLQGRYYPESPQLLEVLSAVGLRQVVNLRA